MLEAVRMQRWDGVGAGVPVAKAVIQQDLPDRVLPDGSCQATPSEPLRKRLSGSKTGKLSQVARARNKKKRRKTRMTARGSVYFLLFNLGMKNVQQKNRRFAANPPLKIGTSQRQMFY